MVTGAQKKATKKYEHNNYEKITVRLHKGERGKIQVAATAAGESLNGYIIQAIAGRMDGNQSGDDFRIE